jgi:hypothetical protein
MLAAMSPSGSLHAFDMDPVLSADVYSQFINMERLCHFTLDLEVASQRLSLSLAVS